MSAPRPGWSEPIVSPKPVAMAPLTVAMVRTSSAVSGRDAMPGPR